MARKSKKDEAEEAFRKFARLWLGVDKGEITREEIDVGLYVATYVTATGDKIPEYSRQIAERYNQSVDFDGHLLPTARDYAKFIIEVDEADDSFWSKTPANIRQEAVRVARNIQTTIRCLENIRDRSDLADLPDELKEHHRQERQRKALAFAFQIGDQHRTLRMLTGPARLAKITTDKTAALKKGFEEKHGKLDDNVRATVEAFERVCKEHPTAKKGTRVKKTADRLGIGKSTVYDHLARAKKSTLRR